MLSLSSRWPRCCCRAYRGLACPLQNCASRISPRILCSGTSGGFRGTCARSRTSPSLQRCLLRAGFRSAPPPSPSPLQSSLSRLSSITKRSGTSAHRTLPPPATPNSSTRSSSMSALSPRPSMRSWPWVGAGRFPSRQTGPARSPSSPASRGPYSSSRPPLRFSPLPCACRKH